jgi:hypothetical protein
MAVNKVRPVRQPRDGDGGANVPSDMVPAADRDEAHRSIVRAFESEPFGRRHGRPESSPGQSLAQQRHVAPHSAGGRPHNL